MPEIPPLVDTKVLRASETALALNLVSEIDLLRLKAIARLHARGLPPAVSWEDLLQEAFTRVIVGSRTRPEGVTMVALLAGVMRSLKAEYWRSSAKGAAAPQMLRIDHVDEETRDLELRDQVEDPERSVIARQEMQVVERLFADDPVALKILSGLAEGLTAEQIRANHQFSKTTYDSARKRIRRSLLREGLTCGEK